MRSLYSLLLYLALPPIFAYFLWRGRREPDYRRGWHERLGFGRIRAPNGIWLHAASVGEVQAAVPLVRKLRERYPEMPLLITVFTPTGRERAIGAFGEHAQVRFLPLDLPGAVRRFLRRARPRLALVVETEIWPNLLHVCRRQDVPAMLVNGRLSARSARQYARWPLRPLITGALRCLTRVAAASGADAERFLALGLCDGRVIETGNLKFDLELPENLTGEGEALRAGWGASERAVWIAASTHDGEEQPILEAFARLRRRYPDLLLVLVPRHPQRFDAVAGLLADSGLAYARRSRSQAVDADTQVLLGDTLGELPLFYAAGDLAFVGGSLVRGIGGHNLLEPAALHLPAVVGPHLDGWAEVAGWLEQAGALRRTADVAGLCETVDEYLGDKAGRQRAGTAAARVVAARAGGLERTLRLIAPLLADE